MLQAVAGEAVGEIEIADLGMAADYGILVECVVVVMADPGIDDFDRLEGWDARGERRPDALLEPGIIDLPVHVLRFLGLFGRQAADEMPSLGTKIDARNIDGKRRLVQSLAGGGAIEHIDVTFACGNGQVDPGHGGERTGAGAGGVDQGADLQAATAFQVERGDEAMLPPDADHLILYELSAVRQGFLAEEGHQRLRIEPTFARPAESAGRQPACLEPGKILPELLRAEKGYIGTMRFLRLDVCCKDWKARSGGEQQIPLLAKADIGIGPESIFQTPEKVDHDLRHQNVLRRRELLTHTTGRTGSAAGGKRRVLLNDNDSAAIEGTQLSEVVGRGASDDATAYDHNVLRPTRHALTM